MTGEAGPAPSDSDITANKALACRFIEAFNRQDVDAMAALLHPDFIWNTAVTGDDDPNELRPLQSRLLAGRNLPHARPRLKRDETLAYFRNLFETTERNAAKVKDAGFASGGRMTVTVLGMTAEDDRVAMEAKSEGVVSPSTYRTYGNFYHILFRIRDGLIILYKEYQDTLHVFDFVTE